MRDSFMDASIVSGGITHDWIGIVAKNVQGMKFGVVQITVHDSRVVQIEKTEKLRLERTDTKDSH
jgi:hypothetical protein